MTDLAARIEAGPGSRELSDAVLDALGWEPPADRPPLTPEEIEAGVRYVNPNPTRSVDDAIGLIGCPWWSLTVNGKRVYATVGLLQEHRACAPTPALALSAAMVRAAVARAP